MKITIKTLQQEAFSIEIDENKTVLLLKLELQKITNNKLPADEMTLIYSGLIMENDKLLSSYKIDEKKFLVAMIKPKSVPSTTTSSAATSQETSTTTRTNDLLLPRLSRPNQTEQNDRQINESIQRIVVELGFPEDQVRHAFRITSNNPDHAIEYLLSGTTAPANVQDISNYLNSVVVPPTFGGNRQYQQGDQQQLHQDHLGQQQQFQSNQTPLAFLRQNPRFYQMRVILQQNRDLLESVLAHIAHSNIDLFNLIIENQEEFLDMINEPIGLVNDDNYAVDSDYDVDNIVIMDDDADDVPNENEIMISQQDKEAIDRLKNLGFSEIRCVEAYFACDKNEELAANFLCSQEIDE